jgi:hypothetical protein
LFYRLAWAWAWDSGLGVGFLSKGTERGTQTIGNFIGVGKERTAADGIEKVGGNNGQSFSVSQAVIRSVRQASCSACSARQCVGYRVMYIIDEMYV